MTLKEAVARYLQAAGQFGQPLPLGQFQLSQAELEAMLSAWDEDYHLHRHFELVPASWLSPGAAPYRINGSLYSAIIIRESIRETLD